MEDLPNQDQCPHRSCSLLWVHRQSQARTLAQLHARTPAPAHHLAQEHHHICYSCNFHLKMSSQERITHLIDPGALAVARG